MLFETVIKYSMLFIALSVLVSLVFRLTLMIISYMRSKYIKRKKKHKNYALEDAEIPIETHEQLYAKLKKRMLEKQQEKYEEIQKAALQNKAYEDSLDNEEAKIVALAEPQGKWTKLFLDQIRSKFLARRGNSIKSKWTLLVSLYGRSQGKYRGRHK